MKKLSIIIPVYNEAPFLRRCLNSVREANTAPEDVEVIIMDDCSNDGSEFIVNDYVDDFKVIHSFWGRPFGVSYMRNYGIEVAKGEYITFLDSDDRYTPKAVSEMLKAADGRNIVQFNHVIWSATKGKSINKYEAAPGHYDLPNLPPFWVGVWNKIYKREFIEKNKIRFDKSLKYGEDELFNLDALAFCPFIEFEESTTVIKHRDNPRSLSKIKRPDDLLLLSQKLTGKLWSDNDDHRAGKVIDQETYNAFIRKIVGEHWNSKTYIDAFGG